MSQSMTALISSVNTKFYVISSPDNKVGQQVDTRDGKNSPSGSILLITPAINGPITVATISSKDSDGRLFISLNGTEEKTKLTWSDEKYSWIIRQNGTGSYAITPANGADLYWFDEFNVGVGYHVEVRAGRDVQPPQNEWLINPL